MFAYENFWRILKYFSILQFPRVPFGRFRNLKIKYLSLELYGFDRRVIKLNFMKLHHQNRNFIILAMRIIFNYEENFEAFVTAKEGLAQVLNHPLSTLKGPKLTLLWLS